MSAPSTSLLLRASRWAMWTMVRAWPEKSKTWGVALAAEGEEIALPSEGVRWALGGVIVFSRALGSHLLSWLKLPAGVGLNQAGGPPPSGPAPRLPRLVTMALLVGAAVLLFIPEGREAIAIVSAMWSDEFRQSESDRKTVEKVAARAERENDPQTMAFAALSLPDEKRKVELADRAVTLEPRLAWIYGNSGHGDNFKREWSAKLRQVDPDNAVPYLFAADAIADSYLNASEDSHLRAAYDHLSLTEKDLEDSLAGDVEWTAMMHRAFQASRYNGYYLEHTELNRQVWNREPDLSFSSVMVGLWAHPIPNLLNIRVFTLLLIHQAEEARKAGHLAQAETLLREADGFADRIQRDPVDIVKLIGLSVQRQVALGWKSFYMETGRPSEAQAAALRVEQIERQALDFRSEWRRISPNDSWYNKTAWIVQMSAMVIAFAAAVAILSIGLFELWPAGLKRKPITRRVLSWAADLAPPACLAACIVFLLGFLPYARLLTAFRAGGPGAPDEHQVSLAFWSLLSVTQFISGVDTGVARWTALTVFLSLVAAVMIARMVYRARRAQTKPA